MKGYTDDKKADTLSELANLPYPANFPRPELRPEPVKGKHNEGTIRLLQEENPWQLLLQAGYEGFLKEIQAEKESIENTPGRVLKALKEMTENNTLSNAKIAERYGKTFPTSNKDLIVVKDIKCWTVCMHHLLPFSLSVKIGVIPAGHALGLSKYARICQAVAKRLQMQERFVEDVADVLKRALLSEHVAVVAYDSQHTCACARGAQERDMTVTTSHISGLFTYNSPLREEFLRL